MNYYSESNLEIFYGTEGSAGLDLPFYDPEIEEITVQPGESALIKTGIHMAIPKGHVGFLDTRSSTSKLKLDLLCRTIDLDFRGNIKLSFINLNKEPVTIKRGDYLAQIILLKICDDRKLNRVNSIEELGKTNRGSKGFGEGSASTYKNRATDKYTEQALKNIAEHYMDD